MRITVRHLKRLTNAAFGGLQAVPMYGSLSMSVPTLTYIIYMYMCDFFLLLLHRYMEWSLDIISERMTDS